MLRGNGRWFYNPDPEFPTLDYFENGEVEGESDYFVPLCRIKQKGGDSLVSWMTHLGDKN
jgi:hypothetical protein